LSDGTHKTKFKHIPVGQNCLNFVMFVSYIEKKLQCTRYTLFQVQTESKQNYSLISY